MSSQTAQIPQAYPNPATYLCCSSFNSLFPPSSRSHSEWMLDDITPAALVRFLPSVYQGLLSPARLLYRLMGPDKMRAFDDKYGVKSEDHISFSGYVSVLATAVQTWLTPDKPAGKGAREAL